MTLAIPELKTPDVHIHNYREFMGGFNDWVETLADSHSELDYGLSQSALERRFRRNVGTSPRRFASILRLKNAVRLRAVGHDFTSIAHSAGYSDQSHFTNDFKRVTGLAPSAFFQQSSLCRTSASLQVAFASN